MGEWVLLVEGTELGRSIAMCLALMAAVLHAAFAAMQKGIVNPWIMRGAIDISYGIIALPIALIDEPHRHHPLSIASIDEPDLLFG